MDLERLDEALENVTEEMFRLFGKEPYDIETILDAARAYRGLLANGERVEADYEAALTEYLRLRWAEDGLGPYAEELADEVLPNGVKVPRISNFEEAKRVVDAAIGGKLLVDYPTEED